ncbi:MAG: hypothetical protein AB8B63_18780 [Granulosicoccus sp.]
MTDKKRKYGTMRIHTLATSILLAALAATGCTQFCNSDDCRPEAATTTQEQILKQEQSLSVGQEARVSTENQPEPLLTVASIVVENGTLMASVVSNGCTRAEDFHIDYQYRESDGTATCNVTLVRDKPDYCRRSPAWVSVSLPWQPPESCNDLPVEFSNPVVESETLKRPSSVFRKLPDK